jgi:uncharacterized protein YjiS (DUF1127 family)
MNAFEQDGALAKIRVAPMVMTSAMHDRPSVALLELRAPARAPWVEKLEAVLDQLSAWRERRRQRRRLADLDDHLLRDIGLSRAEVELECHKPFWRA